MKLERNTTYRVMGEVRIAVVTIKPGKVEGKERDDNQLIDAHPQKCYSFKVKLTRKQKT